jgi:hypothetical protein
VLLSLDQAGKVGLDHLNQAEKEGQDHINQSGKRGRIDSKSAAAVWAL